MADVRNDDRTPLENQEEVYEDALESRGVKKIRQFGTPKMRHPTAEERLQFERIGHVWKIGDRFYKLAHQYYGNVKYWWVIAWYNKKPTESHVELGELIKIPAPLSKVLQFLKYE